LSGVTVDGQPLATSQSGSIAANLQARDVVLPQFAAQSDALAANLIGAFQSADPTVAAGQAGLFTDAGNPLDPAATAGLAGRIALNASADPAQGGAAWRMAAGAQAAAPAPASDSSTVVAFLNAMSAPQSYAPASGLSGSFTLGDAAAQIGGLQQSALAAWTAKNDDRTQQAKAAQTALGNATGVNVDQELQRLLIVQQTYSASAQVLQVASNMLAALNNAVAASA